MTAFHYAPPPTPNLPTLFEDAFLIALDKPAGLLSVPGRLAEHKDSLFTRVLELHPEARVIHRLDLATSGVIVMAKSLDMNRALSRAFQQRAVEKRYQAVVEGHLEAEQGLVDLPLICDWPNRPRQMVDHETGKPAQTAWTRGRPLVVGGLSSTRMHLSPLTGRTHQLRVHMAEMGHAILGDRFYASELAQQASDRLMLHAQELRLSHPVTGEPLSFEAPCPF